ncbi:MAG: DUF4404 family protein [Lysobacterales bacterium]
MKNSKTDLLGLLEALRRELAATTLDTQQASELARLIDAIEARASGREPAPDTGSESTPESVPQAEPTVGVQQHLIDELSREATALEAQHPDTMATVRTLINMLSNLGI